jgi:hypothetical protein
LCDLFVDSNLAQPLTVYSYYVFLGSAGIGYSRLLRGNCMT